MVCPRRTRFCASAFASKGPSLQAEVSLLSPRRNSELVKPLTITHPELKGLFITGHEAVSLVLQAFAIGNHGDTLVLDLGEPVRILDLARTLDSSFRKVGARSRY